MLKPSNDYVFRLLFQWSGQFCRSIEKQLRKEGQTLVGSSGTYFKIWCLNIEQLGKLKR